ncbi:MAG: hypothetical protein ACREBG_06405 [Pyrinomonadaceae bacterium]
MTALSGLKRYRYRKLVVTVLLIIIVASSLCLFLTRAHWWRKLSGTKTIYDGQVLTTSAVYRSPNGELLVNLKGVPDEPPIYIVYPSRNDVGLPNERHFIFLPEYAFSRYVFPPVVFMKVKAEIDPGLIFRSDSVEFTTLRERRVQVIFE